MTAYRPTVAVIGGGFSGLVTAHTLAQEAPEVRVIVFEASPTIGGKLRTLHVDGVQVEAGADSFLAGTGEMQRLCHSLGIEKTLVAPAIFGGLVWEGNALRPMPTGTVMGIPASPRAALKARALSVRGRLRALGDLVLPGPLSGPDVAVGSFIRRRFGSEVLDRMVDPLLAGTRAGDADEMSLAAALPQIDAVARKGKSVMRGLDAPDWRPVFLTPRAGMTSIVHALALSCTTAEIRTGTEVEGLRARENRYELSLSQGHRVEVDAVAVCVPAPSSARILAGISPTAAGELSQIDHASVASILLIYAANSVRVPPGSSGVLVPRANVRTLSAATWWSIKWPHTTPEGSVAIRCFVGRSASENALAADDATLVEAASRDIATMIGVDADPQSHSLTRWTDSLPQYRVGHLDLIARVERSLLDHPGVVVAGADFRGSGLPDCYRQAVQAARKILGRLRSGQS